MKYYTRSPEEWRKRDEEKERQRRARFNARRRSLLFLLANLALAFSMLVVVRIYISRRPPIPGVVDGLQVVIKAEDEIISSKPLDVKVWIYNRDPGEKKVTISEYHFEIMRGEDKVYTFDYPHKVPFTLKKFEGKLVFDLRREMELKNLKPGDYNVTVSMNVNEKNVKISKKIEVVEKLDIAFSNLSMFYFLDESIKPVINIVNFSGSFKNIKINKVQITMEKNGEVILKRTENLSKVVKVGPEESISVGEIEIPSPETGKFVIKASVYTDEGIVSKATSISVIKNPDADVRGIRIVTDFPKYAMKGDKIFFHVYLVNDTNKDRYILVKRLTLVVSDNFPIFSKDMKNLRIWLEPYSQVEIYKVLPWEKIAFTEEGNYKLDVVLDTYGGLIHRSDIINIVEK